jgi:hypothetical protein
MREAERPMNRRETKSLWLMLGLVAVFSGVGCLTTEPEDNAAPPAGTEPTSAEAADAATPPIEGSDASTAVEAAPPSDAGSPAGAAPESADGGQ